VKIKKNVEIVIWVKNKGQRSRTQDFILVHSSRKATSSFLCQQPKNATRTSQMYTQYIQDSILYHSRICATPCCTSKDEHPIQI